MPVNRTGQTFKDGIEPNINGIRILCFACGLARKGRRGRQREKERERGFASEGNGVSFRGIDVSQYTPDAVDTPICNPRPQSLPSRNCVLKVRQGESYSSPSAALTVFLPPPLTCLA